MEHGLAPGGLGRDPWAAYGWLGRLVLFSEPSRGSATPGVRLPEPHIHICDRWILIASCYY